MPIFSQKKQGDDLDRQDLLKIAEKQDRKAMHRFYARYQSKLPTFLFRLCRNLLLCEEVFNDTMLLIWQRAAQFNGESKVSTWVYAIAYRQCLKRLAKEKKHQNHASIDAEEQTLPASDNSNGNEEIDWVRKALELLSPEHRAVIELSYYVGCDYQEIATIVDCPVNTVKTRMFHARKKMKVLMSQLASPAEQSEQGKNLS